MNSTPTNTARAELLSIITFHHANTRGSSLRIAHLCVLKIIVIHVSCMFHSLPHLTLTTSTSSLSPFSFSSPIFPTVSPSQTSTMNLNPCIPCDGPRQSCGSTQIPSLTGYEPKTEEFNVIDAEAINPEDLEPRRIELDRNFGTEPNQIQERSMRKNLLLKIWMNLEKLLQRRPTSSHRCVSTTIQRRAPKNTGFTTVFAKSRRL